MNNSENRLERKCSCCGGENPEKQRIDAILEKYADVKGPLIPILQEVQNLYNYLPKDVLEYIADKTGTPISEIYGVVTFYSLFHLNPRGRNVIRVCQGTACHVRGGKTILQALEKQLPEGTVLSVVLRETPSADNGVTAELLASCFDRVYVMPDADASALPTGYDRATRVVTMAGYAPESGSYLVTQ